MTTKHTPTPWEALAINGSNDTLVYVRIGGPDGQGLAFAGVYKGHDAEANADLIVKAVNSYDDTLEALEQARWLYDQLSLGSLEAAVKYGDNYEPPTDEQYLEIRRMIESAITKAKGTS